MYNTFHTGYLDFAWLTGTINHSSVYHDRLHIYFALRGKDEFDRYLHLTVFFFQFLKISPVT